MARCYWLSMTSILRWRVAIGMRIHLADNQILDAASNPYVHENVGEAEVRNLHDVPTALAYLRGSKSSEIHAETALYMAEDMAAMMINAKTGKSANMVFYDRAVDPLNS
eukprot:641495-Prymnesium_polylepis.1